MNTLADGAAAVVWAEALGSNVLDVDGNLFVDLTAGFGVASIGHRHPRVVAAVTAQAGRLLHGLADVAAHPARVALAERLAALAPMPDATVYFATSGSDAIEVALKTAVLATGHTGVLAFRGGYHGLTLGSLAATSRPEFRRPFAPHLHPHVTHAPYGAGSSELAAAVALLPGPLAAILVEPLLGREGIVPPPPGWLAALAALAARAGALLVVDEVFTGFGRTGKLFAVEHHAVVPDLICCGKALGGGLPIGVVLGRRDALAAWPAHGEALHTGTFLAHPISCAAALATLDVLESERLVTRSAETGRALGERLMSWPRRFARVQACRGQGMAWGVVLDGAPTARRVARAALAAGVFCIAGGFDGDVVALVPPLSISAEQCESALTILEAALADGAHA